MRIYLHRRPLVHIFCTNVVKIRSLRLIASFSTSYTLKLIETTVFILVLSKKYQKCKMKTEFIKIKYTKSYWNDIFILFVRSFMRFKFNRFSYYCPNNTHFRPFPLQITNWVPVPVSYITSVVSVCWNNE